jgi:hypothetical protein
LGRHPIDGRFGAHSYRELSCQLPPGGIELDLDHNEQRVGELVHAELGDDDRLRVVCVIDDERIVKVLDVIEEDIFFSPTLIMIGDGVRERT